MKSSVAHHQPGWVFQSNFQANGLLNSAPMVQSEVSCIAEENAAKKVDTTIEVRRIKKAPNPVARPTPEVTAKNSPSGQPAATPWATNELPAIITRMAAPMISHCCSEKLTFGFSGRGFAAAAGAVGAAIVVEGFHSAEAVTAVAFLVAFAGAADAEALAAAWECDSASFRRICS